LFSVLALLAGVLIGRFAIPLLEVRQMFVLQIFSTPAQEGCRMRSILTESRLEKWTGFGGGEDTLKCGESVDVAPDVRLACECS
jgi:hypothetical protein